MGADVLSDVLKTVRLTGAAFFDVIGKAPWAAEQSSREAVLPLVLAGAEHLISYHVITEGSCYAALLGEEPITVEAGEIVVFTHGDRHVLSSSPGMRAVGPDPADGFDPAARQLPFALSYGDDGPISAKVVCGFLACDARPFNPLLDNLPRVLKAGDRDGSSQGWIGQFISFAIAESNEKRAGGETVLARLSELMFIEVVRRYLDTLPPERVGWLAGLRDPFIGKALSLLHAEPARDWTLEELARTVGLSRSVLAERFADIVGIPPMQYLAQWRMQLAAGLLAGSNANMAAIAAEIGYESEASFSRAFKKMVGASPSLWRRRG